MARLLEAPPARRGPAGRDLAPRAAPHVCHPPARGRGRPALDPGAPGPRFPLDDSEVHAPRRRAAGRGLPPVAPEGMKQSRVESRESRVERGARAQRAAAVLVALLIGASSGRAQQTPLPPLLAEIDKHVREEFWDTKFKGVDWDRRRAPGGGGRSTRRMTPAERDAAYDRLLALLDDSHTFRVPAEDCPSASGGPSACASAWTARAMRSRVSSRAFQPSAPG